jgi:hypothetical protein
LFKFFGPALGVAGLLYSGIAFPQITTSDPSYQGCYSDQSSGPRAFPNELSSVEPATIEICKTAGAVAGFSYVGLQYGSQCWAGNNIQYNKSSETNCNLHCVKSNTEICGGIWYNSVYATAGTSLIQKITFTDPTSKSSTVLSFPSNFPYKCDPPCNGH